MNGHPLAIIQKLDNELFDNVKKTREMALTEGVLSQKTKLLIAIALDAAKGSEGGVRSLTEQAIKNGASKDEIMETIRVTNFICGASSVYPAAYALKEIF